MLKLVSITLVLFILSYQTTCAQTKEISFTEAQKEEMAKNMEDFFTSLNLTSTQKTEFESISQKYTEQLIAVKDEDGSRYTKFKKVKSIRKNKDKEMKKLLDDNQYSIYQTKQKEMKEKMKTKRKK